MHPSSTKRLLFLIFIFLSIRTYAIADNPDEKYIQKVTSNKEKLCKKGRFIPGRIFFSKDTIDTEILCFNNSNSKNYYLFVVSRVNDEIRIFTAEEVVGYEVDDRRFFRHSVDQYSFFILLTQHGKADLYERRSIPSDIRYMYYIKKTDSERLFAISPDEDNIVEHRIPPAGNTKSNNYRSRTFYTSKNIDKKFKQFIQLHFSDCRMVLNSVETEFLTINNIPEIIEIYNNCADY